MTFGRSFISWTIAGMALAMACVSQGASSDATILKVLPQFLDLEGRTMLAPSLYERDAYQAHLRDNPQLRSGQVFKILWRSPRPEGYRLQVEVRGSKNNTPTRVTLEKTPHNRFGGRDWTEIPLTGEDYVQCGEVLAWRVSLWEGDTLRSEDTSYLW